MAMTGSATGKLYAERYELTQDLPASHLYNHDLAPTRFRDRTWGIYAYMALWIGMAHCIPTYMLAAGLIEGGMNWWQAILTILLGNVIVLIPMLLNSYAGTKYGIPFPVICRSSFGVYGANVAAIMRAIVACGWFGIQTWIGGEAIDTLLMASWPTWSGVPYHIAITFMAFWAINMLIVWYGMESIRRFENWAAPAVLVVTIGLLIWAVKAAHGFGPILAQPGKFNTLGEFMPFFIPALTGMVGYWATLSLNMPDFTRFARGQDAQMVGQTLGLPTTMTIFSAMGIMITSATVVIYGAPVWDPIKLIARFENPLVVILSMITIAVATLSVNVAANIVSPAFDFSNLLPRQISFRLGGLITGVIGILMMPWKLLSSYGNYLFTWLIGYSSFLGAIAGIMIADFWLVRKTKLNLVALYQPGGIYRYSGGFNIRALIALVVGILPNLPGFLVQIKAAETDAFPAWLSGLYHYAWFVSFVIAFVCHWALMGQRREEPLASPLVASDTGELAPKPDST